MKRLDNDTVVMEVGERFDNSIMRVNTTDDQLCENIRTNIAKQFPQFSPLDPLGNGYSENPRHLVLVGSGWSLKEPDVYEELRQQHFEQACIVALNGSAKWLLERNIRPSAHVILDARPENIEFITDPIPGCKYFLCSQVHPSLFDKVADRDVTIFHALTDNATKERDILDDYYGKHHWFRIPACGNVGVTSMLLFRFLGYKFQHLFGYDSCYKSDGEHHAFPQSLNDKECVAEFKVGTEGRVFKCSPWQAAQARNFLDVIQLNGALFELNIHGDGLLAYLIRVAAKMPDEPITPEM